MKMRHREAFRRRLRDFAEQESIAAGRLRSLTHGGQPCCTVIKAKDL